MSKKKEDLKKPLKKAYMINGGAGRVLCAVPALERRLKTDKDFIIICARREEIFIGTELFERSFDPMHNRLFEDYLVDREIIDLEPYYVNEYYTQQCSIIDAFDILINGDISPTPLKINIGLSDEETAMGATVIEDIKKRHKKTKVLVLQPFGQSAKKEGGFYWDNSGRSFKYNNLQNILEHLHEDFALFYMGEIPLEYANEMGVSFPGKLGIRQWFGIINSADGFIGCDSLGQHAAYALDIPAVVGTGGTSPINVSYPNAEHFKVFDYGKDKRRYSPIRITKDDAIDRNNERLMQMTSEQEKEFVNAVYKVTGIVKGAVAKYIQPNASESSCCSGGSCES